MSDEQQRQSHRSAVKQHGLDAGDVRRKREELTVTIRKNKREESLNKRRNVSDIVSRVPKSTPATAAQQPIATVPVTPDADTEFESLEEMVKACRGTDPALFFPATQSIRQLLSVEHNPPIAEVLDSGILPRLIQFLTANEHPKLQFEAAWAITNIASGNSRQTQAVLEAGAVPLLIGLMNSPDPELREQAVWGLGNIAGDSSTNRDYVIRVGIVPPLIKLVAQDAASVSLIRNATWAFSNLCRGKPAPDFPPLKPALPTLCALLRYNDMDVLTDALWGLSYLTDGGEVPNQAILEAGIPQVVVPLLRVNNINMQIPAMRALGNIVTGTHAQTQGVIEAGILPAMVELLKNPKKCIKKEACWVLSNIAAGTRDQVIALIQAHLVPALVGCMSNTDTEIRKEACWAICNAVAGVGQEHIGYLISQGFVEPMCLLLECADNKMITVILETIETILKAGEAIGGVTNPYVQVIEDANGVELLEELEEHANERIYNRTVRILEQYFQVGGDEDGEYEEGEEGEGEEGEEGEGEDEDVAEGDTQEEATAAAPTTTTTAPTANNAFQFVAPPPTTFPGGFSFTSPSNKS
ncbi:Importin subunit alpha-1 [Pelomyxa schiedti]|nr:Importin subunit alpha-1 [Pelomyxa schiedti]